MVQFQVSHTRCMYTTWAGMQFCQSVLLELGPSMSPARRTLAPVKFYPYCPSNMAQSVDKHAGSIFNWLRSGLRIGKA
jgi:hypothetical protein